MNFTLDIEEDNLLEKNDDHEDNDIVLDNISCSIDIRME